MQPTGQTQPRGLFCKSLLEHSHTPLLSVAAFTLQLNIKKKPANLQYTLITQIQYVRADQVPEHYHLTSCFSLQFLTLPPHLFKLVSTLAQHTPCTLPWVLERGRVSNIFVNTSTTHLCSLHSPLTFQLPSTPFSFKYSSLSLGYKHTEYLPIRKTKPRIPQLNTQSPTTALRLFPRASISKDEALSWCFQLHFLLKALPSMSLYQSHGNGWEN